MLLAAGGQRGVQGLLRFDVVGVGGEDSTVLVDGFFELALLLRIIIACRLVLSNDRGWNGIKLVVSALLDVAKHCCHSIAIMFFQLTQ